MCINGHVLGSTTNTRILDAVMEDAPAVDSVAQADGAAADTGTNAEQKPQQSGGGGGKKKKKSKK